MNYNGKGVVISEKVTIEIIHTIRDVLIHIIDLAERSFCK